MIRDPRCRWNCVRTVIEHCAQVLTANCDAVWLIHNHVSVSVSVSSPVSIQTQRKRLRLNGNRASVSVSAATAALITSSTCVRRLYWSRRYTWSIAFLSTTSVWTLDQTQPLISYYHSLLRHKAAKTCTTVNTATDTTTSITRNMQQKTNQESIAQNNDVTLSAWCEQYLNDIPRHCTWNRFFEYHVGTEYRPHIEGLLRTILLLHIFCLDNIFLWSASKIIVLWHFPDSNIFLKQYNNRPI